MKTKLKNKVSTFARNRICFFENIVKYFAKKSIILCKLKDDNNDDENEKSNKKKRKENLKKIIFRKF